MTTGNGRLYPYTPTHLRRYTHRQHFAEPNQPAFVYRKLDFILFKPDFCVILLTLTTQYHRLDGSLELAVNTMHYAH